MAWKIRGDSCHSHTAELSFEKGWPTSRLPIEINQVTVTFKPQLGVFWMEHVHSQPGQLFHKSASFRRPPSGVVFSLDVRCCSLFSGPILGIISFLFLCGAPGWALESLDGPWTWFTYCCGFGC